MRGPITVPLSIIRIALYSSRKICKPGDCNAPSQVSTTPTVLLFLQELQVLNRDQGCHVLTPTPEDDALSLIGHAVQGACYTVRGPAYVEPD